MTGYYKIATCDRCGFEKRIPKDDPEDLLRLPDGWECILSPKKKWDLCPECKSKYNAMMIDFVEGKAGFAIGGRVYYCDNCNYADKCDQHICFKATERRSEEE